MCEHMVEVNVPRTSIYAPKECLVHGKVNRNRYLIMLMITFRWLLIGRLPSLGAERIKVTYSHMIVYTRIPSEKIY